MKTQLHSILMHLCHTNYQKDCGNSHCFWSNHSNGYPISFSIVLHILVNPPAEPCGTQY